MKRIDIIYERLKKFDKNSWVSASDLSDELGFARSNISSDLNKLCHEGKVKKKGTKPVLYQAVQLNYTENFETYLDNFAKENPSLFYAIEQAKAAVLYPPKGMPILLLGETGVGKSMFAELIHKYAIQMNKMDKKSPFIVFNCADYANNPQLLLSQIFGSIKGAYTGADTDKVGLIEKANGGILFLDEVHRLPPEGQEMFFTFMDRGTYRRLGETEVERTANVLLISATTENPDSVLLKTFTRRIPMIIYIPKLCERSIEERFNLICKFFREESARLGKQIMVSVNSMRAFLSYSCPNNIGQLKTDIQISCAKAYSDYISRKNNDIIISSINLPSYIKEGLYTGTDHRQIWNKLIGINKRFCIIDSSAENILFKDDNDKDNIYDMIDIRFHELKSLGLNDEELEKEICRNIDDYFANYIHNVNRDIDFESLENIVAPEIIRVVEEIIKFAQNKLNKVFNKSIYYGLAIHISSSIERIKRNGKIINPQLNKIRTEYNIEFNVAIDCLKIIDRVFDITMPIDEAGFLTMFFVYNDKYIKEQVKDVKVIVIAHGPSTATSMAETANKLLGTKYAVGINAPLEEKPQQVLFKLKDYLKNLDKKSDVLLLVDMGSFTNFGDEIEKELGIIVKTLPLVSTLHVIEATRKAMLGYSINEVYQDTLNIYDLLLNRQKRFEDKYIFDEKMAIITICTTGEGSAAVIKNLLKKQLEFDDNLFEIISLNISGKEDIYTKLKNIENDYKVLCIISPFKIKSDIMQFELDDVFKQETINKIQKLLDIETTYIKIADTLDNHLQNINGKKVLKDIKLFVDNIEKELNIKINTNILIGITLHIACMIDRLKSNGTIEKFEKMNEYISQNIELYTLVKRQCELLNIKYNISIPDDEICNIMIFFNTKAWC